MAHTKPACADARPCTGSREPVRHSTKSEVLNRRKVLDLLADGKSVASIAHDLDISDQTISTWRRQDRIDSRLQPGLSTAENAELSKARKRIADLEAELAISRRATELLKESTSPKDGTRPSR